MFLAFETHMTQPYFQTTDRLITGVDAPSNERHVCADSPGCC